MLNNFLEVIVRFSFGVKILFLLLTMAGLGLWQLNLTRSGSKRRIRIELFAIILSFIVVNLSTTNGADFVSAIIEGFMFLCSGIVVAEFWANPKNFPSEDEKQ